MNRRTVLHDIFFRHATVQVWTHVHQCALADDQPVTVPVAVTDYHLGVSLHRNPVTRDREFLDEHYYPGYRRLWIPRIPEVWQVRGHVAQMLRMWDFPPCLLPPPTYITVRAYALWMGDAVIASALLPDATQLECGDVLSIAFQITMDPTVSVPFIRH